MTWKVTSREGPARWLESTGGVEYTADPETAAELASLTEFAYPLTPVGPVQVGVRTPSELFGAAWYLIPSPAVTGEHPPYPDFPSVPGVEY